MTGWLIVNEYLNTEKFKELQGLFLSAAKNQGVKLLVHTNAEFTVDYSTGNACSDAFSNEQPDFVIFYDKDIALALALESMGFAVLNCAAAIETCDSKALTSECVCAYNKQMLETDAGSAIRTPATFKVPFTYANIGISKEADFSFLNIVESKLKEKNGYAYPVVIKESFSSFGMGVYLANDRNEAIDIICEHGKSECIIQEFVTGTSGEDVRLQMVGDECVAAMKRSNSNDFRSNITNGGKMSPYEPTEEDVRLAVNVMRCLELDFAGIDIMHDSDGRPVFCEANSNAHFKNLYDLTGINAAEKMLAYAIDIVNM